MVPSPQQNIGQSLNTTNKKE